MWDELAGGALIGIAASVLWLTIGRISGISGVISNVFALYQGQRAWSLYFLLGLLAAYPLYVSFFGTPDFQMTNNKITLALAGLLVGLGTYIGNGCTSGHGVCGTARLSMRSIAATCTFMVFGILTVFVMNNFMNGGGL